jgi:CIC family chloride channel protein
LRGTKQSDNENWFYLLLLWREKHINERTFVLIISFFVGLGAAFAAIVLKNSIHLLQSLLTSNLQEGANYLLLLYPVAGILLSGLFVKFIVRDDISHGVTKILFAISQRKSRIKPHNMWSSMAASSVTIGFGGSVGAEAPIVLTGAAIGSNLGRLFRLEQKTLMLLVGCGAAGAVAGIFKAPIAGLVFVIEVLMLDLTMTSVLPLLIASVTAATMSYIFTGAEPMFRFSQTEEFALHKIPYTLLLGIFCGLVSLYFTRASIRIEGWYRKFLPLYRHKFIVAAAALSLLIFLFPPLYGEGYNTIGSLLDGKFDTLMQQSPLDEINSVSARNEATSTLNDNTVSAGINYWRIIIFLLLILFAKVFASTATNSGGGCGGIFAPSLYMGCIAGFLFSHISNFFPLTATLSEKNFALLGMAGVMSGVMHAPLTGVFLIAELTGGYQLFLPLLLVSISSYATIIIFEPHSLYSMRLAQKGELMTHHKDQAVLTLLKMDSIIETDFIRVNPTMTLGELVRNAIAQSPRSLFPVVENDGRLLGIVQVDNIRNIMFRPELYERFRVSRFMLSPPAKILNTMSMEQIMRLFDDTKAWNLPVIDENGAYLGFVSKSKIFNAYREALVDTFMGD